MYSKESLRVSNLGVENIQISSCKLWLPSSLFMLQTNIQLFFNKENVPVSTCKALQAYNKRLTPTLTARRL
jgi:hypothetical protein